MTQPNQARLPVTPAFAVEAVRLRLAGGKGRGDGVSQEDVERIFWTRYDRQASLSERGVRRASRGCFGYACVRSLKLKQEWLGEEHADSCWVEPGGGAGASDEGDGTAHAELLIEDRVAVG
jgi:hypothetical protein